MPVVPPHDREVRTPNGGHRRRRRRFSRRRLLRKGLPILAGLLLLSGLVWFILDAFNQTPLTGIR